MSGEAGSLAPHLPAVLHVPKRGERAARLRTLALLAPAILLALLFLYYPLVFILQMSFTEGSSFLSPGGPISTLENYATIANRYLPNVLVTLQLAFLATAVDLVFGFPFAYILVRKVRYRTLVRGLMVFPMFGALYIAFGMRFILLPGGTATPVLQALGIASTDALFSLPSGLFAMSIFTFPFMALNIGTCAEPLLLGSANEQRALAWTVYQRGVVQTDYGLSTAMGVVLLGVAFVVTYLSLRYSRGALVE